ncbi:MAG: ammonia monooxygenase [Bacteroidetes bacterium]|nr:ammonia monooxygenase [Bacteroidota bacterium]
MKPVLKQVPPDQYWGFTYLFDCPGCGDFHGFNETIWQFNGDLVKPTISPSILVTWTEFSELGRKQYDEWYAGLRDKNRTGKFDSITKVCHCFIREGRIQFLGDCWHELKGQTVDLPPATPINPD